MALSDHLTEWRFLSVKEQSKYHTILEGCLNWPDCWSYSSSFTFWRNQIHCLKLKPKLLHISKFLWNFHKVFKRATKRYIDVYSEKLLFSFYLHVLWCLKHIQVLFSGLIGLLLNVSIHDFIAHIYGWVITTGIISKGSLKLSINC